MFRVCGLDSTGLWEGPAVSSSEPSFPNCLSTWMTYLHFEDRHSNPATCCYHQPLSPLHELFPHSNETIWPDSNNSLTVSSKLKRCPSSCIKYIFTKTMQTLCCQTLILSNALLLRNVTSNAKDGWLSCKVLTWNSWTNRPINILTNMAKHA
jgi:hypothetical protein